MRYLRVVRKSRWASAVTDGGVYTRQDGALEDLRPTSGRLSVFRADTESMVTDVLIGIAASRDYISPIDYALLDSEIMSYAGIRLPVQSDGRTPYRPANALHHDLMDLTADDLIALSMLIHVDDIVRIPQRHVRDLLLDAVQNGRLDLSLVSESLSGYLAR